MQKKLLFLCLVLCVAAFTACECKQVVKQEPPPPAPAPAPVEEKIVLNGIRFDFNKAVIKPEFVPVLDEAVAVLQKHPGKKVTIEGNTDAIGSDAYNMKLGQRRADSVKKYLVEKGIAADTLTTESFGESKPVADNKTKEGRAMNRRVEFKVAE
ncbi:MAG: OmpA family protein [Proteobacteria bacterium]|nr:OmpA family protein [Pseudomonadota bacterium]